MQRKMMKSVKNRISIEEKRTPHSKVVEGLGTI